MAKKGKTHKSKAKKKEQPKSDQGNGVFLGLPPIFMLDRSALIVWAKQPFIDWLNGLPDNEPGHVYTEKTVNDEPTLYLLPPYGFDDQIPELLNLVAPTIFAKQLEAWCVESEWWPKGLEEQKFDDWFRYELTSIVNDLVDNEPVREEY